MLPLEGELCIDDSRGEDLLGVMKREGACFGKEDELDGTVVDVCCDGERGKVG